MGKCPEKSSRKIPRENPPNFKQQNPPTHFCRLAGATFHMPGHFGACRWWGPPAIFRPLSVSGPFPTCSCSTGSQPYPSKCSKSRDFTAIAIRDSKCESQIASDLRQCDPSQKRSICSHLLYKKLALRF